MALPEESSTGRLKAKNKEESDTASDEPSGDDLPEASHTQTAACLEGIEDVIEGDVAAMCFSISCGFVH